MNLYFLAKHISQNIDVSSRLYSSNGEIESENFYPTFTLTEVNLGLTPYPLMSFTENFYTTYFYEQSVTPLTISATATSLYFSLFLPVDLTHLLTEFRIYLPATIAPNNLL